MTQQEIKKHLDHGDYLKIERICAARGIVTNRNWVAQVVRNDKQKPLSRGKAKKILEIATELAQKNLTDKLLANNNTNKNE